eukprot:TRINITY_DN8241_c0_g1_i1.p1 TRINITY_DN8241_c0_g1~~TRINITY_DN8241_c0_g1_i1.p1  ORF type:complete len:304 (+),score=40.58 TRINITY_DN8241_c0_g1_i1:129-1040(+)
MSENKPLTLQTNVAPYLECSVSPLVLFSVLDHYLRRNEAQHRVIGTLLGTIDEETGFVHVKNSFPVPHTENETVGVLIEFHQTMTELFRKVQPAEVIVGWYATGSDINDSFSVLLHDFYFREMNAPPVHLLVDTQVADVSNLPLKAFHAFPVQLSDKGPSQHHFIPLPWRLESSDHERIAFNVLTRDHNMKDPQFLSDLNSVRNSVDDLYQTLTIIEEYVDKVIKGDIKPDDDIGRFILDTLSLSPVMDVAFDKLFTNGLQDILMVIYLANLTRSHLLLTEKLQLAAPLHANTADNVDNKGKK